MSIFEDAMVQLGRSYDDQLTIMLGSYKTARDLRKDGIIPEAEFECLGSREKGRYTHHAHLDGVNYYQPRAAGKLAAKMKGGNEPLSEVDDLALRFGNLDLD